MSIVDSSLLRLVGLNFTDCLQTAALFHIGYVIGFPKDKCYSSYVKTKLFPAAVSVS